MSRMTVEQRHQKVYDALDNLAGIAYETFTNGNREDARLHIKSIPGTRQSYVVFAFIKHYLDASPDHKADDLTGFFQTLTA